MGHFAAQLPQWLHADASNLGMKRGGAITPGTLNAWTVRIALQQHPQHEHDTCPLVDSTFMIQVTSPRDFASRLISDSFDVVQGTPAEFGQLLGSSAAYDTQRAYHSDLFPVKYMAHNGDQFVAQRRAH